MTEPDLNIRPMRREELDLAVEWAAREGWNPGLRDADAFWAEDPGGFLIALADGEPAAVVSIIHYGEALAFLGFYIASTEHRGLGLGYALWQTAISRAEGRTIGLDGVVDQQENYRRSGFMLSHRNIRFEGRSPSFEVSDAADELVLLTGASDALRAVDKAAFGATRSDFLAAWLTAPGHRALGAIRDGRLAGYGVARPCRLGTKIGPLFARDAATAEALLAALSSGSATPLIWDIPEPNAAAVAIAERAGMAPSFETARMYRGPAPEIDDRLVFGVTSFELG